MNSQFSYLLVTEGDKEVCSVQMPVAAMDAIEDLFPEETAHKIRNLGFNFEAMSEAVKASQYAPQNIMDLSTDTRRYQIWIK